MIKKFKIYENKQKPQIGDYVIINIVKDQSYDDTPDNRKFDEFLSNNIGEVVDTNDEDDFYHYQINYNLPQYLIDLDYVETSYWTLEDIIFHGTKEQCEIFLQTVKYNL